jgi:hypothetical protein
MHSEPEHQLEVGGQLHALAALHLEKESWCPLDGRVGGSQSQSEHYGAKTNRCLCQESNVESTVSQPIA